VKNTSILHLDSEAHALDTLEQD